VSTPFRIWFTIVAATLLIPASAAATPRPLKGICDDASTLYGNPDLVFREASKLGVDVIRIDLNWGGPSGVAGPFRTVRPTNPNDGVYDWTVYDRAVLQAARYHIAVLFSIVSTPAWANGERPPNVAPDAPQDLRDFAYAAATRYSGAYRRPSDGVVLPRVRYWLAWNEPNNPVFLSPQYQGREIVSARTYAAICSAVVTGVKSTRIPGELVACGATAPRGNNSPQSARPSVSPLAFLRAFARAGGHGFDAWAHHPYAGQPDETPATRPAARTAVTLGNFDELIREVTRLYGRLPIWITEYGYQTNPPDDIFGVSYAKQSAYLRQAYAYAAGQPRITVFIWFLLRDEPRLTGWQSGLDTRTGRHKPAWRTFRSLAP
jgi:Glycosyl hydrolase catalytic core